MTQHNNDMSTAQWGQPTPPQGKKGWSRRRTIVVGGVAAFVILAVSVPPWAAPRTPRPRR
ncbi:hypothetical protein GIY30_23775 [Gordonia sp. HNM0687]|uniref:Uncharacterized protein n=1 Tax=Gordonia mangrovi TaxID=2665643 RepID=A0A6L7GZK3_9ACTN|nr:hypothetical protein [Gordonia mangrovi]MXP24345.1 hypothetical protein [Gordonia mangrovi]UVF80022.1 hypothetical protein NWF22_09450 [Gordonia mangrovi]